MKDLDNYLLLCVWIGTLIVSVVSGAFWHAWHVHRADRSVEIVYDESAARFD